MLSPQEEDVKPQANRAPEAKISPQIRPMTISASSSIGRFSLRPLDCIRDPGPGRFRPLPVAQYPEIAPPFINVTGQYPGASADVVASTWSRHRGADKRRREHALCLVRTRRRRALHYRGDLDSAPISDIAQVQVQNRVSIAQPRLPADVRNIASPSPASPEPDEWSCSLSPDNSRDTLSSRISRRSSQCDPLTRIEAGFDHGVRQSGFRCGFGSIPIGCSRWHDRRDVTLALQGQNIHASRISAGRPAGCVPGAVKTRRLADSRGIRHYHRQAGRRPRWCALRDVQGSSLRRRLHYEFLFGLICGRARDSRTGPNGWRRQYDCATMETRPALPEGVKYNIVYDPTRSFRSAVTAVPGDNHRAIVLSCWW